MRRPRPRLGIDPGEVPRRTWVRLGVLAVLVAYVVAFVAENAKHVHVHFVLVTASVSLIWVILLCLAIGLLAGLVLPALYRSRRRTRGESRDSL